MSKHFSVLVVFLLLVSQSAFAYYFVSVAAVTIPGPNGSARAHFGRGWSHSAYMAQSIAMRGCGYQGCQIIGTTSSCMALAYDNSKRVMAQIGFDVPTARNNVNDYCHSSSNVGGCTLWATLCANGYFSEP